jgi:hypothetical protein
MIVSKSPLRRSAKQRERKLVLQTLERRQMLATVYVNDNWHIANDTGPTGLSTGDMVDNSSDPGAPTITAAFGSTAFSDIEAAIAAAANGDTISVLAGSYAGDIEVNKSVKLEGANAGVSAGTDAGTRVGETVIDGGFQVSADGVRIDGFTISGGTTVTGGDTAGIFLASGASEATLVNNVLTGEGAGRGILSAFNGDNDNVLIQGNDISGWATAIYNQSNDNVDILNNVIHDNTSGVANDFVNDVLVQGNDFKTNAEAIGTFESTALVATGNDLADNTVAIANYGGAAVSAIENFWGTVDPAEITAMTTGAVLTSSPLAQSPFDVEEVTDLVFSGDNGVTLTVNPETGDFTFTDGANLQLSGTGAVIKNGKLMIHTHDELGRKVDVKGDVGGAVEVVVKQLGHGNKKQSFALMAETETVA